MGLFFSKSDEVKQVIKGLELTRALFVSSIIIGEENTGKKCLVKHLFPNTPMVSGKNQGAVEEALGRYDELVITDFEKLVNAEVLDFDNKKIIATADYIGNQQTIDDLFAFIYAMPPLKERHKDTAHLKKLFLDEAIDTLMLGDISLDTDSLPTDLSANSKSLRGSIYRHLIIHSMGKNEIEEAIYDYLHKHINGNSAYKDHLELYEKPLIEAGLAKYGSQLKLSSVLGINRNTLRKKIHEHSID